MTGWLLFAFAVAAGMAPLRLAVLLAAVHAPFLLGPAILVYLWRARPRRSVEAALFCDAVSAELRAGATVTAAVAAAAESVGAEAVAAAAIGVDRGRVAEAAAQRFPEVGRELAEILSRRDGLGTSPSVLFDEIATLALARSEVAAEVAAATAPARATALVLLGAPVLAVAWVAGNGDLGAYLTRPAQRVAALGGLALVALGTLLALAVARRG